MKIKESSRQVLVCQNRTCRKQSAAKVLAAFGQLSPSEVEVVASSCLGQCGNGPMVLKAGGEDALPQVSRAF